MARQPRSSRGGVLVHAAQAKRGATQPGRSRASRMARLIGMLVDEAVPEGHEEDLEVEGERPVLDVEDVVLDALLDRGVAAPAVDLRPAGEAALDLVAQHVARDALAELVDEDRPLRARPDEAHLPAEDVDQLRQL